MCLPVHNGLSQVACLIRRLVQLCFQTPKAVGDNLTVCNSSGTEYSRILTAFAKYMLNLTFCARLCATKHKHAVTHTQACLQCGELCQSSLHIISKTSCIVRNVPVWQLLRCVDTSHCQGAASLAAAPAQTSAPRHQLCVHLGVGQAAGGQGGKTVTCLRL